MKFIKHGFVLMLMTIFLGAENMGNDLSNVKIKRLTELLPNLLVEKNIDCWLTFTREGATDPLLPHLGSDHMVARAALIFILDENGAYHRIAIAASYDVSPLISSGIYNEVISYKKEGVQPHLQKIIRRLNPGSIALNISRDASFGDGLTAGMLGYLEESLPEYKDKFVSAEELVVSLFSRKTEAEIDAVRTAVERTQMIIKEAFSSDVIKPGITTEKDVADYLLQRAGELELTESCLSIVVGPMRGHDGPSDRIIQYGDLLRSDICFKYLGYSSDIQRTAYILKPGEKDAPEFVKKHWQDCKDANMAALAAVKPGRPANDADQAGRNLLVSRGYDEYPFGSGHTIGKTVHDIGPLPAPDWPERYGSLVWIPFEPGMTFAIEPAVIVNDERLGGEVNFGLEEDILVTNDGYEVLGELQDALWIIK